MTTQDSKPTRISMAAIQDILSGIGYDTEPAQAGDPPDSTVVARRDLGDRAMLVVIDAGGRFRIRITRDVEESAQSLTIDGIAVRAVETVKSTVNLTGQVTSQDEANRLMAALPNLDLPPGQSGATQDSLFPDTKPQ